MPSKPRVKTRGYKTAAPLVLGIVTKNIAEAQRCDADPYLDKRILNIEQGMTIAEVTLTS